MSDSQTAAPRLPVAQAPSPPAEQGAGLTGVVARLLIPLLALLLVAVAMLLVMTRWDSWVGQATVQVTDDAYIRAEMTRLSTRVAGTVRAIPVQDFQRVKAGDLLMEVDPADYAVQVAQAEAGVAGARAALDNLDNQSALQRATLAQAEAQASSVTAQELQARRELTRQQDLLRSTYGTRQKQEQAEAAHAKTAADVQANVALIDAQHRQLDVLAGTRAQRAAELHAAEATLAAARLKLGYTRIVAPFDGVVSERQVQVGDYVNIGTSLITVVPLPDVYVIANYKETQLTWVRPGQPVDVSVDTFPGQVLHGHVERLSPASGSQFALLPADNATGNFTKVVQRIPVRISIDADQPLTAALRPGMSVTAHIDTGAEPRP